MANDIFSESSSTGWFGRIGESIKGVLFGLLLIVVSFPVLFLNEGRAVKTARTLDEGGKTVIAVSTDKPESKNEGKLVYFTGKAEAKETLTDPDFGVSAQSLKLRRKVEFYQWEENKNTETRKKLGGGEEKVTTYEYVKKWDEKPVDSSGFKHPQGHENPQPVVSGKDWVALPITVGGFTLSNTLVGRIENFTEFSAPAGNAPQEKFGGKSVRREGAGFYLGNSEPGTPEVGDLRVSHLVALPGEVSVIAAQAGNGLKAFIAKAGGSIEMLQTGTQSAEAMFATAKKNNTILTWALRLLGVVLMFVGFTLLFRPLSVMADLLPIAGDIVGFGTGLVALLLALPISLIVIAVAWIAYRPMIGIPLVVLAVAGFVYLIRKLATQRKQQIGTAAA